MCQSLLSAYWNIRITCPYYHVFCKKKRFSHYRSAILFIFRTFRVQNYKKTTTFRILKAEIGVIKCFKISYIIISFFLRLFLIKISDIYSRSNLWTNFLKLFFKDGFNFYFTYFINMVLNLIKSCIMHRN